MDAFVLRENAIPQKFKQFTCRPADPAIYDGMGKVRRGWCTKLVMGPHP